MLWNKKKKKREQLSKQGLIYAREEVVKTEKFRSNAEKLYSYLKHINALDADKITIVDMGMLGTATEYTCDVIKQFEPEKDVSSYLFFSRSTINSFIDEKIPNLKLNAVSYAAFYESFPKTIPSVDRLKLDVKKRIYVPDQDNLTEEESKWICGMQGEVVLGSMLVDEAVRACSMQYLFGFEESEEKIRSNRC